MSDEVWQSLHVHRLGGQDDLLVHALGPTLTRLREQGLVRQAFFLRYWEGGHHVRIRTRTPAAQAGAVTAELTAALTGYSRAHPDDVPFDLDEFYREAQPTMAALEGVPVVGPVHPSGTVRAAPYEPEYGKYGGAAGVAIAERFFDHSSTAVLAALPQLAARPARRLGLAFTTMLRALCAAGLTPGQIAAFFGHYCQLWSPYVFDEFLGTWPGLLAERRAAVAGQARRTLDGPHHDTCSTAVGEAITAAYADPAVLPAVTLAGAGADHLRRRDVLLGSYLHTHNNRLGLSPEREALLGFLGHHVLTELAGLPATPDLIDRIRTHRARRLATLT